MKEEVVFMLEVFMMALPYILGIAWIGIVLTANLLLEGRDEAKYPCMARFAKWSLRITLVVCFYIIWKYDLWC